jgi:protein TonB
MPQYPGGELQMQKDIMENAPYPEMEKENNIQGKVYVQFVVEKDGAVTNVRVQRGVQGGPNLSRVAENAVKKLKKFAPAKQNGRPVRLVMTIPVNFTLK